MFLRVITLVLESEADIREDREQGSIGGDVAQALKWRQRIHAAGEDDIFRKGRTIRKADARIGSDARVNPGLEQQQLQWIGTREEQQIFVEEQAELRREVDVHTRVI